MCHDKLVNIFIEINRKRNNGKIIWLDSETPGTRLDSKVFRNDSDSTRLEKWLDPPIPGVFHTYILRITRILGIPTVLPGLQRFLLDSQEFGIPGFRRFPLEKNVYCSSCLTHTVTTALHISLKSHSLRVIRIGFAYLDTLSSTKIFSKLCTNDKSFCSSLDRLYLYYIWSISIVYSWDGYRTSWISIGFLGFLPDFSRLPRDF